MQIAVINVCLRPNALPRQLPAGLAYVATTIESAGYDFDLIDLDIDRISLVGLNGILASKKYDVYCLGCIVSGFRHARSICEIIRKNNPDAMIILGNSVAAAIPKLTLTRTEADVCVLGEGDQAIVEILQTAQNGESLEQVRGIAFSKDDEIITTPPRPFLSSFDSYGFPNWRIFDLPKYRKYSAVNVSQFIGDSVIAYPLTTARGCPYNCTFCYITTRDSGEAETRYRRYSEAAIKEEIIRLHDEYGANFISFWDDYSFPNKRSVQERIETLSSLPFQISWAAPVRSGLFSQKDHGLLQDLMDSGCNNLAFSLENADPLILEAINKKISVGGFIEQCHALKAADITPLTSVIFGYPQETVSSIRKTLKVCEEAGVYPSVGFLLPLPGTAIYEEAKAMGKIQDDYEYLMDLGSGDRQDFHINLTSLPDDILIGEVTEGLENLARKQGLQLKSVFKTVLLLMEPEFAN